MMRFIFRLLTAILTAGLLTAAPAAAQDVDNDRIPRFASEVEIEPDGSFLVTETIDFEVMPGSDKHGIYRDFPTLYRGFLGLAETVSFDVLDVTRDGEEEPYVLIDGAAGVRVRIGHPNILLSEGVHRYRLVYRTDRQLFFHTARDEIYWDVTGNEWAHPIDHAEVAIHLPEGAFARESAGYTGYAGEDGKDYTESKRADGAIVFETTRTLQPGEGLTVAVAFPKGYVEEPGVGERLGRLVADNLGVLVALLGLIVTFAYFLHQWRRVGRDPEAGVIVPLFEAPDGLSPAATGYVWAAARGGTFGASKAFTVALTSLGIKRRVIIEEDGRNYTLSKQPEAKTDAGLPAGERAVMSSLFGGGADSVTIKPAYKAEIGNAVSSVLKALEREHDKVYFRHNMGFWILGLLLALATIVGSLLIQYGSFELLPFIGIGGLFGVAFSIPVVLIGRQVVGNLIDAFRGQGSFGAGNIIMSLFILPFAIPGLAAIYFIFDYFGFLMAVLVVAQLVNLVVFFVLLKAPSRLGRDMMDRIEGYLLYLTVAEEDRLNMLTAEPQMTVERFEHHLPYAMALGVEREWSERFTATASAAAKAEAEQRQSQWYHSRSGSRFHGVSSAASGLASGLSSTLSRASTRPSSSSSGGSSGGGSSGGGGGGGGGGSW